VGAELGVASDHTWCVQFKPAELEVLLGDADYSLDFRTENWVGEAGLKVLPSRKVCE
jgi:hypothetical protein